MLFKGENFVDLWGVILSRKLTGEKGFSVNLFLESEGIVKVSAKKSSGNSEPFIWARFYMQKKRKSSGYFVTDVDVTNDMLALRDDGTKIAAALKWIKLVSQYLPPEQPDDDLLMNLFDCMNILVELDASADVSDWRFLWHWLNLWGLAPELDTYYSRHGFNKDEISLLSEIDLRSIDEVEDLFSEPLSKNIRENLFKEAADIARGFLVEK